MEDAKALKGIGLFYAIVYLVLLGLQGPLTYVEAFLSSLHPLFLIPLILVLVFLTIAFFLFPKQYRLTSLIFFLSFVLSGIVQEFSIPIPLIQPLPPPESIPMPMPIHVSYVLITPMFGLVGLILSLSLIGLVLFLTLVILSLLPLLTTVVMALCIKKKLATVAAMIWLMVIILAWTFLVVPFGMYFSPSYIFTPVPSGPLIALVLIPRIQATANMR